MKRKASFLIAAAAGAGFLLILGATAARNFRLSRLDRECQQGDLSACWARCKQGAPNACQALRQRCQAGDAQACEARPQ